MIWIYVLGIAFLIFFLISLVLYFTQDYFVFHAVKLDSTHQFEFDRPFEEINLKAKDGALLNGIHFYNERAKGIVLYFHNHAGNVQIWGQSTGLFFNAGYDVLLMDYRGFGKSGGSFNEDKMISDVQVWCDFAKNVYPESDIVIYGKGMGAFFAVEAAVKNKPILLVLESPMYSLRLSAKNHYPFLPVGLILKYKMDSSVFFPKLKGRVLMFHGKLDKVIPYTSAEELYVLRPENTDLILLEDTNNSGVMANPVFLRELLKELGDLNT
ncbi:alpha/beta hydrolase [Namhaeicola litoreus]|uniref:Alpha/beta hydrolase n=1 Tax=Namhaeicola litoreus TaxID=1052145 RepID=A0ABW3XYD1_9FLAO